MLKMKIPAAVLAALLLLLLLGCNDSPALAVGAPASAAVAAIEPPSASINPRDFEFPLGNVVLNGTLAFDQATDSVDLDLVLVVRNPAEKIVVKYFFKIRTNAQGRELIQLNCEDRPMYALEPYQGRRWIDALGGGEIMHEFALIRIDGAAEEPES